ncbi:MAG: hypothetical protein JXD18_10960 [Anaerolineae bacterium]|nr:hypothetical protein [Anaerolineae bacterium]
MVKRVLETSSTPRVVVTECLGDLVVKGSDEPRVMLRLQGSAEEVVLEQAGETITFASQVDAILACPLGTTLSIAAVRGDLRVKSLSGSLSIGTVNGDVSLQDVGPVAVEEIFCDMRVQQVAGDLVVASLRGDGRITDVAGMLSLQEVGGDLRVDGVRGGMSVQVGSDVRLGPPYTPGAAYRVEAGSDVRIDVPEDASLSMSLRAGGRIRSHLPALELVEGGEETTGVLGTGGAALKAVAAGHISLREVEPGAVPGEDLEFGFVGDFEGLGAAIEMRIADAMAEMEAHLQESLGRVSSDAVRQRIEHAHHEVERARHEAQRAAEQARLQQERAERRWQRVSGHRHPPAPPSVSDEERMRVLRMVEEGRVSPEQAADLLAALEGR